MISVIVTDIFGETAHLQDWCTRFDTPLIISPYAQPYEFGGEQEAYQTFREKSGMHAYIHKVRQQLCQLSAPYQLIGFSAGGSASWVAINDAKVMPALNMTLFYPGQIRDYLELTARCATHIIMAKGERHFDQIPVIRQLARDKSVTIETSQWEHGFMNPLSTAYSALAEKNYSVLLK